MTAHNNGNSVTACLVGTFLGAGSALLLAPQTGAQLRKAIRNSTKTARKELSEAWKNAQEQSGAYAKSGNAALKQSGAAVESAMKHGRDLLETGKTAVKEAAKELKQFRVYP